MPIYEYLCHECGIVDEFIHAMDDVTPRNCCKCIMPMSKIISSSGVRFIGGGFYETDYKPRRNDDDSES